MFYLEESQFAHNPFGWFDNETEKEKTKIITRILDERAKDGFAGYDWINFDQYYSRLIIEVASLVNNGKILSSSLGVFAAERICNLYQIYSIRHDKLKTVEEKKSLSPVEKDFYTQKAKELPVLGDEIIEIFFRKLLPELPFVDSYSMPVADRKEMVNTADYLSAGNFMVTVFRAGVEKFKTGHGFPGDYQKMDEWVEELNSWIVEIDKSEHGCFSETLITKILFRYHSLWD